MLNQNFVILGVIINLIGTSYYIRDTIKGKTKPNRASWFLWALAPLVAFFAEIGQGVGLQALMTFTVGFAPLLVLISSFISRKSVWKLTGFDYFCAGLSLAGLFLWYITKVGNIAILMSILSDGFAVIPTLIKSWKYPETESYSGFLGASIGAGITLLTVKTWNFETYGFPIYIFSICIVLTIIIKFKLGRLGLFGDIL